jgi:hypothetical protein
MLPHVTEAQARRLVVQLPSAGTTGTTPGGTGWSQAARNTAARRGQSVGSRGETPPAPKVERRESGAVPEATADRRLFTKGSTPLRKPPGTPKKDSPVQTPTVVPERTDGSEELLGPFLCRVDSCAERWEMRVSWQKKVLRHFHSAHDHLISELVVQDTDSGKMLRAGELFEYLGQCNKPDCLSIIGVNARRPTESMYEIHRGFKAHYAQQHPGSEVDFSFLVEEHVAKFEAAEEQVEVRCARCRALLACARGAEERAVKEHYASVHNRHLANLRQPEHYTAVGEEEKEGPVSALGPLTCRVAGCREEGIANFGRHFESRHRAVQMERVKAVGQDGRTLVCTDIFTYAVCCDFGEGCDFVTTTEELTRAPIMRAMRQHWRKAHPESKKIDPKFHSILPRGAHGRRSGEAPLSPVKRSAVKQTPHPGYRCLLCSTVLGTTEMAGPHCRGQHRGREGLGLKDLATGARLPLADIYAAVGTCEAPDCGMLFYSQAGREDVVGQQREHMDDQHSDMVTLGPGPASCGGFQCMAGAEEGEVVCSTVIPQGNNGDALRHWQYKHHSLPLRDLVFMDQTSGMILQISDVFKTVLVCGQEKCGVVTYTNFLGRGGKLMETHYSKEHGQPAGHQQVGGFSLYVFSFCFSIISLSFSFSWSL